MLQDRTNFFMDDNLLRFLKYDISRPAPWALLTRGHAKKIDLTPIYTAF
jgi:hypothetical protein